MTRTSSEYDILHESANIFFDDPQQSEIGRRAWKAASRAAKHMTKHSAIVDPKLEKTIPRFESSEMVIGKHLGSGGFNNVFELDAIDLLPDPKSAPNARKIGSELQQQHRSFVARHVYRESSGSKRYAVKFLSPETVRDEDRFCTGAADLVVEAKFLASLSHPHIVRLRGMAAAGTSGFASREEMGYFLILDRLSCTLDHRLEEWKQRRIQQEQTRSSTNKSMVTRSFLAERLHVAFDVASALQYLHDRNIIYRDLKPDNIGFDIRGDVKLFDFGLAKELDEKLRVCDEFYELSGNTGSLRYMAPEVALSEPYNLTADVYGFGLLLWQVASLDLPYDGMSRQDHSDLVVHGHERPSLDVGAGWSTSLRILMKRCWEAHPSLRPPMEHVSKILRKEITNLRDGDGDGLEPRTLLRRKSTFVFRRESTTVSNSGKSGDKKSGRRRDSLTSRRKSLTSTNSPAPSNVPIRKQMSRRRSGAGAMAA